MRILVEAAGWVIAGICLWSGIGNTLKGARASRRGAHGDAAEFFAGATLAFAVLSVAGYAVTVLLRAIGN